MPGPIHPRAAAPWIAASALATAAFVRTPPPTPEASLARDILQELVEIDTTDASGNTTTAAESMAKRLRDAGFPTEDVHVVGPHERKGNLVARFRGAGFAEPLLLLAHLDVVDAHPDDWSFDPFRLTERNGLYFGRGTADDKSMAAIWIANFVLMKREGFVPNRDLIVALTADEEGGAHNGVQWLLENRRELIEAELALNEGGNGWMQDGQRVALNVQLSEKTYQSFRLEVRNRGGHSSVPRGDNAIVQLARALTRIADHRFPPKLDAITSAYFERMAAFAPEEPARDMLAVARRADPNAADRLSDSPYDNALLRTTCTATELFGGHAENALPQSARATVNCRLLPGDDAASVRETLVDVIDDDAVTIEPLGRAVSSDPSPLSPAVMGAITHATESMWPGVAVVPTMSTGATDGLYLRNAGIPTYGVSGLFFDSGEGGAHGRDEHVGITSFFEAREFLDRLTRLLAGGD